MWSEILHGFLVNLQPNFLFVLMVGTLVGLIIGALPGLSAVSGVALLLPFTFSMDPAQGLVMLAAVYMSAEYGGSISAILINTPGTSGAACTVLDGHPLTRKGKAQEALYVSLLAGTVGGAFGALVLLFLTPVLARASLMLGPAEIFWVAAAGLALVAHLTGGHTLKGLIGATIGIGITLIGQDAISGDMRFTFDDYRVVGGIPLVPVLLGLFAVASILELLEQPHQPVAPLNVRKGILREVVDKLMGMKRLLLWSSALGSIVGIIPGAGASLSAFVAYGEAKRISKNPEEFGKGSYEGVAAPEAANNAVVGGAMVPLLALGIPGSASAAIMFGALTVHGIIPGPRLFTERGDLVHTFMVGLMFTVFAMLIIGLLSIRWSSQIVRVPRKAMVPGVLVLSIIGTYGLANSLFDVYILLAVGFAAYLLSKIDVPPVAIALGAVLGSIMEESFQQAAIVASVDVGSTWLYFATRPLSVVLMILAFGVLGTGIYQILTTRKDELAEEHTERQARGLNMRWANVILAITLLLLAAFIHMEASDFSEQGALFPRLIANAFILFGGILLAINLMPKSGALRATQWPFANVPWLSTVTVIVLLILLAWGADIIGFYESAFLFTLVAFWMLAGDVESPIQRTVSSIVFAFGFTVAIYVMFKLILEIATPPGILV